MSIFRDLTPPLIERVVLITALALLTLAAWLALWMSDGSSSSFLHAHHIGHHTAASGSFVFIFLVGWTVMTVAMMLPTTLPVLAVFHRISALRDDRYLLLLLVIIGYLAIWVLFGALVYGAAVGLKSITSSFAGFQNNLWLTAPLLLVLAGAFQFTSLKYRCLDKCRSPFSFVIEHWRGKSHKWNAFRLGVDNGIFCVGCCWALMLLMFIVGVGNLLWMLILAILMAVEKNVSWGRRISAPLGIILISSGALLTAVYLSRVL